MERILIGGCDRSGTTMLGALLGGAPSVVCLPESPFMYRLARRQPEQAWDDVAVAAALRSVTVGTRFGLWGKATTAGLEQELPSRLPLPDFVDHLALRFARTRGRPEASVWVDHTPANAWRCSTLFRLFPDAHMVHVVRDGRGVAASVLPLDWGPNHVHAAARWWVTRVRAGLASEALFPDRVVRVRYEDLVLEPEATLGAVCAGVGLTYEPAMLHGDGFTPAAYNADQHALVGRPPEPARAEAWRTKLTSRQVEVFEAVAGELLIDLGYVLDNKAGAVDATRSQRLWWEARGLARSVLIDRPRRRRRARLDPH